MGKRDSLVMREQSHCLNPHGPCMHTRMFTHRGKHTQIHGAHTHSHTRMRVARTCTHSDTLTQYK
jgi:hypothetical protein